MHPFIRRFAITGLHGYKDVELDFPGRARIVIAENGTGKTTILAALYRFLRGQFDHLYRLPFEQIECALSGANETFVIRREQLEPRTSASAEEALSELAEFTSMGIHDLRSEIMNLPPDITSEIIDTNYALSQIHVRSPFGRQELADNIRQISALLANEVPPELKHIRDQLQNLTSNYSLLYLPTYRRVELPLSKARIKTREGWFDPLRRGRTVRSQRYETPELDIRFGLSDVQERLTQILNDVQRFSNSRYRTISANIIDDALSGRISASTPSTTPLPDIQALGMFLSRVDSGESKERRLETLQRLYDSKEIDAPNQQTLRYFLTKIGEVVSQTREEESTVEKFVEQVNVYLNLSSDEKSLHYDSNRMKVVVNNAWTGDEVDLDALSSGEKQVISLFAHLYLYPTRKILLIDEPELSLSMDWQKRLLPDVVKAPLFEQLLAITHSPFIFDNDLDPYAGPIRITKRRKSPATP